MNLNTLNEFRHGMYTCFGNAKDALFNLVDALCSEAAASSFPELSFSPFFERSWASLYEALEDGQIDGERLRWPPANCVAWWPCCWLGGCIPSFSATAGTLACPS